MEMMMQNLMQNLMMQGTSGNAVSASGAKVGQNTSSKEGNMFFQMMKGMKEQALTNNPQSQAEDGHAAESGMPMPEGMVQLAALWMQMPQGQSPLQGTMLQQSGQTAKGTIPISLPAEAAENSVGNAVQSTVEMPVETVKLQSELQIQPQLQPEAELPVETGKLQMTETTTVLAGADTGPKERLEMLQDARQSQQAGVAGTEGQTAENADIKAVTQTMASETGDGAELMKQQDPGAQTQLPGEAAQMQAQEGRPAPAANQTTSVQRTQETMTFRESAPAENIQKLSELVEKTVRSGVREIEVQLEPAELGKIVIKASYELGKASVLITCSSDKTADILSNHAAELGGILRDRMGGPTQIVLERQPEQYLDQNQNGNGGQQADPDQEERREQQQKKERHQALESDFLQQLRLGIV